MTISINTIERKMPESEPEIPYLAQHSNYDQDDIILVTGVTDYCSSEQRRTGIRLLSGETSRECGYALSFLKPLPRGSIVQLVQR